MKTRMMVVLGCGLAGVLAGCAAEKVSPPNLRLGRDECGECGMIINEDRCSSALVVDDRGRSTHVMFDDLGCMLDYERNREALAVLARYVHDHEERAWVRAEEAGFLYADPESVKTPMGSGIVAYATRAGAEAAKAAHGGDVHTWETLVPARRAWMEARYGRPGR